MKPRVSLGVLYGVLVLLILAQGTWWVIYQTREGRRHERLELQRLSAERRQVEGLVRALSPEADAERIVREATPDLILDRSGETPSVAIRPEMIARAHEEARRRSRMFLWEGVFFLVLLASGMIILGIAHRAEMRFRRSREILLAGVTHEFRTPLAALRLHAETLQRPDLQPSARGAILPRLVQEVERMETLIDQVLEAGRRGEAEEAVELLDASEEARAVLGEMSAYLELEKAHIAANLPLGKTFLGHRAGFATALRNLVQNAAKHSPPPARIAVELAETERELRLSVRDEGPGIAREHQERIFESFERIGGGDSSRTRGSGLGLFLAKKNVEAMGGRIELASQPGHGSTFTIVLPRSTGTTRAKATPGTEQIA
jgi:two-component system sensor histidine kinase SenX3